MSKPAFDPNKPFETEKTQKPAFDPNKNFQAMMDDSDRRTAQGRQKISQGLSPAVEKLSRALDYFDGYGRLALGAAADATGDGPNLTQKDLDNTLVGNAPRTADLLNRSVPSDSWTRKELPIPLTDKGVSFNDALGFVGDTVVSVPGQLSAALRKITANQKNPSVALRAADYAVNPVGNIAEQLGKKSYKAGLTRIDDEVAQYGKAPVSDILLEEGITGTNKQIMGKMDNLSQRLLAERDAILAQATRKGGVVSMEEAMRPAREFVSKIRREKIPALQPIADSMEKDITKHLALDPKKAETVLGELPRGITMGGGMTPVSFMPGESVISGAPTRRVSTGLGSVGPESVDLPQSMIAQKTPMTRVIGAEVPDMPLPQKPLTILTETDPTRGVWGQLIDNSGVNPLIGSKMKSTISTKIPDGDFGVRAIVDTANKGTMSMGGGLKAATENAVERSLGAEAANSLRTKNDRLGRLLSSQDVQAREAAKADKKNWFTSVDGMILGANQPMVGAAKKIADALKTTYVRTKGGKAMMDAGKSGYLDPAIRQLMLNDYYQENSSPWAGLAE